MTFAPLADKDRIFTNLYGFQPWNIDAAIKRIHDGTYGTCEITQKPIAKDRLLRTHQFLDPDISGLQLLRGRQPVDRKLEERSEAQPNE